jgi:hypothetical protein
MAKKTTKQLAESTNPLEMPLYKENITNASQKLKESTEPKAFMGPMPRDEPKEEVTPPPKLTAPEVFRDQNTGKLSGITLPNGNTFLGLKPSEVKGFNESWQSDTQLPPGTQPAGTAQAQANTQARNQELLKLGEQGILTPQELDALNIQEAPIDWSQAGTAGLAGAIPGLAGLAVGAGLTASGVGAIAGIPIAAVSALSVAGAITGIVLGMKSNIAKQQRGEIAKTKDVLAAAKTNMKAAVTIASKDPKQADTAIELYYQQLREVQKAQRKLQRETAGDLNKFMEDGTEDLSDFELFLAPGGYADIKKMQLEQALNKGSPATDEELMLLAQEYSDE